MPLFRFHRGSLSESLKTTVIVKNINDLKRVIDEWEKEFPQLPYEIKIEEYVKDERIGWYSQIVSIIYDDKNYLSHPVGFLSEPLD